MADAQIKIEDGRRLTQSQLEAILSLPDHDDAEIPQTENLQSTQVYVDEAYFRAERAGLLKNTPLPLTASAMLPRPKMAMAHDGHGVPVVITRDKDGLVRAFLNTCTHRGAKLVEGDEAQDCARLTCPFHAWTFNLNGNLLALPRPETFPTLDKKTHGLRELQTREAGGIIWVGMDPRQDYDFSHIEGQLAADFAAFGMDTAHIYKRKRFDLKANWKILLETFMETYHVPPLHKETVAPFFAEVPTKVTMFGPHTRQTTGRSHFTREALDVHIDQVHKMVTHAYTLFPTAVLVTSPYHINFITVMPQAANRTLVDCHMVTRGPADTDKLKDLYARTFEFNMNAVFGAEDFRAAELVQAGLSSGALENVRFGGLEEALAVFHDEIRKCVAA